MKIRFVDRPGFQIVGYSVETSLDESEKDLAALYGDYFDSEKASSIDTVAKQNAAAYYGLMWYLQGHTRYRYLLGKETANLTPGVNLWDLKLTDEAGNVAYYICGKFVVEGRITE